MKEKWKNLIHNAMFQRVCIIVIAVLVVACVGVGIYYAAHMEDEEPEVIIASTETEEQPLSEPTEVEPETEINYEEEELAMDAAEGNEIYEESQDISQGDPFPYYIKVNRLMNTVTVYAKNEAGEYTVPVRAMVCSCGLRDGTPTGVFHTSTKYAWRNLYGGTFGQYAYRIDGPILFHSVPYMKLGDKNSLEAEEYNKLGDFASLGCVRLAVVDAKWLMDNCPSGTTVEIYDDADPGPLGKPSAIRIDLSSAYAGWDPTDPDEANPWRDTPPVLVVEKSSITLQRGDSVDLLEGVYAKSMSGSDLSVSVSGSVDTNTPGTYAISYTAVDEYGHGASEGRTYVVEDTTVPTIAVSNGGSVEIRENMSDISSDIVKSKITSAISVVASDGAYGATVEWDEASISTAVSQMLTQNTSSVDSTVAYKISVRAKDDVGNVSGWFTITVTYVYKAPIQDPEASEITP